MKMERPILSCHVSCHVTKIYSQKWLKFLPFSSDYSVDVASQPDTVWTTASFIPYKKAHKLKLHAGKVNSCFP